MAPKPEPAPAEPAADRQETYRCATCGHGRNLWAWAMACAYGPLAPDGDLAGHDDVIDDGIHEDSIQCRPHPDSVIEYFDGEQWCRWWSCPKCGGRGRVDVGGYWAPGYECSEGYQITGKYGPITLHKGWRPTEEMPDEN